MGCSPRKSGPSCGKSHLEDGRGVLVVVQDGVGVVLPSFSFLELVADLDGDVGKAVPLTKLWVTEEGKVRGEREEDKKK